jgi:hypothetical protein
VRTQLLQRSRLVHAASILVGRRRFLVLATALGLGAGTGVAAGPFGAPVSSSGLARRDSSASPFAGSSRAFRHASRPCSRAPSRRRYVSPAGKDSNAGTIKRPWSSIPRALRAARPGDAIYVREGIYGQWAVTSRNGTVSTPISLRAYPGEHPVLTGRLKIASAYFCVTGFRLAGEASANVDSVLIYVSGAHQVEILRNEILNSSLSGIYVGDEGDRSEDISIIGNFIHDNGTHTNLDHGIYFGYGSGLIANNLVVHNLAQGIKLGPDAQATIATANTVTGNGRSGVLVGGDENWSSNDNLVVNNIVAFNDGWGIRTYWEQEVGSRNVALRNLVFANRPAQFWFPRGGMVEQESIRADPRFVSAGNYRLRAGSPAINRAIAAFSMPFDFNGRGRPIGAGPDLGAYER